MQCMGTLIIIIVQIIWRMNPALGSRPVRISQSSKLEGYLISQRDIEKAESRWNAFLLTQTDDEDFMMDSGSGYGNRMQSDNGPRVSYHFPSPGSVERHFKTECCRLGKQSADKHHSCRPHFYVQRLKVEKLRERLNGNVENNADDKYASSWALHSVIKQVKRCALRQRSEFQKCCYASQASKRKRMRQRYRQLSYIYRNARQLRHRRRHRGRSLREWNRKVRHRGYG